MVDPTTANSCLSVPIRGADVGTWDLPVNANTNAIDSMFGGVTTILLAAANVTMTSTQGQSAVIRLTGTLLGDVGVILSPIIKGWTIDNQITNSPSSYGVAVLTPGSSYVLGCPPGQHDIFYDGVGIYHRNMGRIGEYWDYASSSVPKWVTFSTKPPWLNCNGTTFSSATYPILTSLLGSTTLPDTRGRARMAMNQGTGRVTIFNGDTIYLGGGDQQVQSHDHGSVTSGESVNHTHSGTTNPENQNHTHDVIGNTTGFSNDHTHTQQGTFTSGNQSADHTHGYLQPNNKLGTSGGGAAVTAIWNDAASGSTTIQTGVQSAPHTHNTTISGATTGVSADHVHGVSLTSQIESAPHAHTFTSGIESAPHTHTITPFGAGASLNMPPRVVHGITLIRAA